MSELAKNNETFATKSEQRGVVTGRQRHKDPWAVPWHFWLMHALVILLALPGIVLLLPAAGIYWLYDRTIA